jgi:hypothetical protein
MAEVGRVLEEVDRPAVRSEGGVGLVLSGRDHAGGEDGRLGGRKPEKKEDKERLHSLSLAIKGAAGESRRGLIAFHR